MEIGRDANRETRRERKTQREGARVRQEGTKMTMTRDTKAMWIGGEDREDPENVGRNGDDVDAGVGGWLGERKEVDVGGKG